MEKELYKKIFEEPQVMKSINKGEITFESGLVLSIEDEHYQDCCERVYADWSDSKYVLPHLDGKKIKEVSIKGIEGEGFLIRLGGNWNSGAKVFIPCYNSQNGCYSSDLKLNITINEVKTTVDISNYLEDQED